MLKFFHWMYSALIAGSLTLFSTLGFATNQMNEQNGTVTLQTTYYAEMAGVISPFLEYHPVLPITESETTKANYYKVVHNNKQQLLEMAYFERGTPSDDAYFGTHKVQYVYQSDGNYDKRYFDKSGKRAAMWRHYYQGGDIHIERYTMTNSGVEVRLYNTNNEAIESGIGSHRFVAKLISPQEFIQTQFTLDGQPNKFRNSMPFMTTLISKDKLGFLDKVTNIEPKTLKPLIHDDVGYATLKVHFDEYGIETGWDYLDADGNLIKQKQQNPDIAKWAYYREWTDRRLGQFRYMWVQVYDATGTSTKHANGATSVRYQKDALDRYIEVAYLDENGELFHAEEEGYAKRVFNYKEDGSRVEVLYDAKGKVIR